MPVYLPTAAVGNGRVLVTLGLGGEVMAFFYPGIDFAGNVREGMPGIYVGAPGCGRLTWLFDAEWDNEQSYAPGTNVVVTRATSARARLALHITDLVPPDRDVLVRRFEVFNQADAPAPVTIFQYFWLTLGGLEHQQSVRHLPEQNAVLQYFRDIALAVGGDPFDCIRCGRPIDEPHSAKGDMGDGDLNGQPEDIGRVDLAVGWKASLPAWGSTARVLVVSAANSEAAALDQLAEVVAAGFQQSLDASRAEGRERLAVLRRHPGDPAPASTDDGLARALLALRLLQSRDTGAIIAAPEFDPGFERSGGYGYCWPRDGAFAALTLWEAGDREACERFFDWCAQAQGADGLWRQRYWTDATQAPSWCFPERLEQLDQSATVAFAMARCAGELDGPGRQAFLERHGRTLRRSLAALLTKLTPDGLHAPARDIWEAFAGQFAYTCAALYGALSRTAELRTALGDEDMAAQCAERAAAIKHAVLTQFWSPDGYFVRAKQLSGQLDPAVDSAALGLCDPFELLRVEDDQERRMIEATVATIEKHLGTSLHAGRGIFRFQFETYLGGAIGCVNTLWLAKVLLRLADWHRGRDPWAEAPLRRRAEAYIRFCRAHATPTGLIPELIGRTPDTPYWAAPHAWATALYAQCLLLAAKAPPSTR